jgi:hypothetical protein
VNIVIIKMKPSLALLLQPALVGVLVAVAVTQFLRSGGSASLRPRGEPLGFALGAGTHHLPLVGDAIDALSDPFQALEARVERFGNATALTWWTWPVVVLSGAKALRRFTDAAYVDRATPVQSSWLARTVAQGHAAPAAAGYARHDRRRAIEKVKQRGRDRMRRRLHTR